MELKREDLWQPCHRCKGNRMVEESSPSIRTPDGFQEICPQCKGTGKVLTEQGKVLKEFVCLIYDGDI